MRVKTILQKIFTNCQTNIHGHHVNFLSIATEAVLNGAKITCTSIGRYLKTKTTTKHNIKRIDNMLGSSCLHANRLKIYKAQAKILLGNRLCPLISIDWSSVNSTRKFQILRATVAINHKGGRSLTIYEETHPIAKLNNSKAEKQFLKNFSQIIPQECNPIIITDAGFKCPWFKEVTKYGWDYIGRVRGQVLYQADEHKNWHPCKDLYKIATSRAQYIGNILLAKANKWSCHAFIIKKPPKNRKSKTITGKILPSYSKSITIKGKQASARVKIAKSNSEPWLLVTSLSGSKAIKNKIIKMYSTRMQIEETFRDTKSITYGMGLKQSRSINAERINILLLISTLAHLLLYSIGLTVTNLGKHISQQANTSKNRVLSYVFLGSEYCKFKFCKIPIHDVINTIKGFRHE